MTLTPTPVIDRSTVRLGDRSIDLRRHGVTLAMVSYMLAKPDRIATTRELAAEQYGADTVSTWTLAERDRHFGAIRVRMLKAKRVLERALGGEWFVVVDRTERALRWCLFVHTELPGNGELPGSVPAVTNLLHAPP